MHGMIQNPTTTVFSLGAWGDVNGSSDKMIAYCWSESRRDILSLESYTREWIYKWGIRVLWI